MYDNSFDIMSISFTQLGHAIKCTITRTRTSTTTTTTTTVTVTITITTTASITITVTITIAIAVTVVTAFTQLGHAGTRQLPPCEVVAALAAANSDEDK